MKMIEHTAKFMPLHLTAGSATDPDDSSKKYEFITGMSGNPYVKSETSGRVFYLPWSALISQAVAQGIDEPREESSDE